MTHLRDHHMTGPAAGINGQGIVREDDASLLARIGHAFLYGAFRRVILLAVLLVVYVPTAGYTEMISDTAQASTAAWSLGVHGTLDLEAHDLPVLRGSVDTGDGIYMMTFPGSYLLAVPLYAALGPTFRGVDPVDTGIPVWPGQLTGAIVAAVAMVLLVELLREFLPPKRALAIGLFVALGTPVWSVAADGLWTHGADLLWLSAALLSISRRKLGWAGLFFALAIVTRAPMAIVPAVMGLGLALRERSVRPVLVLAAWSAAAVVVLSLYTQALFGSWLPVAGYPSDMFRSGVGGASAAPYRFSMIEQYWGTFLDTYRGILVFTPVLVPLAFGVRAGWRVAPYWAKAAAISAVVYWVVHLQLEVFDGGYNFWGYRYPMEPLFLLLPVFALGYQERLRPSRWGRRITWVATAASVAMIVPGAVWWSIKDEPLRLQHERVLEETAAFEQGTA